MNTYQLFVKTGPRWIRLADILANSREEALRQAMANLKPEHYDKPIRVEQVRKRKAS